MFRRLLSLAIESPSQANAAKQSSPLQTMQRTIGGVIESDKLHFTRRDADYVSGRHYTDYVEDIRSMLRGHRYAEAEHLLLRICDAMESGSPKAAVAPWYYERLSIMYHKQGLFREEVAVLERFAHQKKAPGAKPAKLRDRLTKAKAQMKAAGRS